MTKENEFDFYLEKILTFHNANTLKDLSEITNIPISTMSSIKQRNSITALKKKCRELGIYNEIFNNSQISNKEEIEDKTTNDLSKYFIALQSVASATNKEYELIEDIKNLMKKYIG